MKSIIVYGSHHHGSTEKLVKRIGEWFGTELFDAESGAEIDLTEYDLIGFASGIDFGRFYPAVTEIARTVPKGKGIYAIFTCARDNGKYGDEIREIAEERECKYLGKFGCRGYNTYGPWKLIGGMNKGCPTEEEMEGVAAFYENVRNRLQEDSL